MGAFALYKGSKLIKLQERAIGLQAKIKERGSSTQSERGYLEDLKIAIRWKIEEMCEASIKNVQEEETK